MAISDPVELRLACLEVAKDHFQGLRAWRGRPLSPEFVRAILREYGVASGDWRALYVGGWDGYYHVAVAYLGARRPGLSTVSFSIGDANGRELLAGVTDKVERGDSWLSVRSWGRRKQFGKDGEMEPIEPYLSKPENGTVRDFTVLTDFLDR